MGHGLNRPYTQAFSFNNYLEDGWSLKLNDVWNCTFQDFCFKQKCYKWETLVRRKSPQNKASQNNIFKIFISNVPKCPLSPKTPWKEALVSCHTQRIENFEKRIPCQAGVKSMVTKGRISQDTAFPFNSSQDFQLRTREMMVQPTPRREQAGLWTHLVKAESQKISIAGNNVAIVPN